MTVVFMPYLASMWDCLAKIYEIYKKKAKVYVVPIPFYGKTTTGRFDKLYYDIDNFPKGVKVTDYHKINLEKLHPDIIFIHNGYDAQNKLTSVLPEFYSNKLKQYTDHLVYVPYFTGGFVADWLINIPGAKNADEIVVESELQRKQYQKILGKDKLITVHKSSKIDYIKDLSTTRLRLPREWRNKIRNKKVILLNTGVYRYNSEYPRYLQILESDLKKLHAKKDIVVVWRPHPLFRHAIIALAPYQILEYNRIVEWFKTWGIYDTSADLQRAVLMSDEYYGDYSSVTRLFEVLNKPVKYRY